MYPRPPLHSCLWLWPQASSRLSINPIPTHSYARPDAPQGCIVQFDLVWRFDLSLQSLQPSVNSNGRCGNIMKSVFLCWTKTITKPALSRKPSAHSDFFLEGMHALWTMLYGQDISKEVGDGVEAKQLLIKWLLYRKHMKKLLYLNLDWCMLPIRSLERTLPKY